MFQTASDQSNPGNTVNAGASKDQKERELSNQLKDAKHNKATKQIIPFETEGTYYTHSPDLLCLLQSFSILTSPPSPPPFLFLPNSPQTETKMQRLEAKDSRH